MSGIESFIQVNFEILAIIAVVLGIIALAFGTIALHKWSDSPPRTPRPERKDPPPLMSHGPGGSGSSI